MHVDRLDPVALLADMVAINSVNPGLSSEGMGEAAIADFCTMWLGEHGFEVQRLERRTVPGETGDTIEAEVRGLLDEIAAAVPDFQWRLERGLCRDPWETDRDAELYKLITDRATHVLGRPPVERGEPYWTDAQLLGAAGIPAVLFGAVGGGAHATAEWVDIASLHALTEILTAVIRDCCS